MSRARYRRSPRVLERRVAGAVLATTPSATSVHELSGGAVSVWDALVSPGSLSELVGRVADAHAIDRDAVADQVERCVNELIELGLAEAVDA